MAVSLASLRPILLRGLELAETGIQWWRSELAGMVPQRWRQRRPTLEVRLDGDRLKLTLRKAGVERQLYDGIADPPAVAEILRQERGIDQAGVTLLLPRRDVLIRDIELPAMARGRLDKLLPFELPRQTPFTPDEACFNWRLLGEAGGRLQVRLAVVERAYLEHALSGLKGCGLTPTVAQVERDDLTDPLDVLHRGRSGGTTYRRAAVTAALCVLVLGLAWAVGEQAVGNREATLALLTDAVTRERKAAFEVEALRKDLTETQRRMEFLRERFGQKPVAGAVADLSRLLPNDIWLYQMQMQNGEIRISGYAPDAAQVIEILEKSGAFQNAQFRSPLTRRPGGELDRFDVSAVLRRGGQP